MDIVERTISELQDHGVFIPPGVLNVVLEHVDPATVWPEESLRERLDIYVTQLYAENGESEYMDRMIELNQLEEYQQDGDRFLVAYVDRALNYPELTYQYAIELLAVLPQYALYQHGKFIIKTIAPLLQQAAPIRLDDLAAVVESYTSRPIVYIPNLNEPTQWEYKNHGWHLGALYQLVKEKQFDNLIVLPPNDNKALQQLFHVINTYDE